jgi:transcriptional regulator with XRE-family HTH domain
MGSLRPLPKRTGEKLLAIRQHLGLSQTDMTKRLNFKGYYGRISDYETGKRYPTVLTLLAYARVAAVTIDNLVDDGIPSDAINQLLRERAARKQRLHDAAVKLTLDIATLEALVSSLLDVGEELKNILDDATTDDDTTTDTG